MCLQNRMLNSTQDCTNLTVFVIRCVLAAPDPCRVLTGMNDFINPWSTNPSYLTSDGKHCLIARQLKRTKATTVDYQIHGPVKNDFIKVTYFGRHEFSTNRNKTIEQVWQQAGWFTCERGEMITTGVRSTVLITESLQFRFLNLLAPEHYFLPRRLRISIGIGRKPHARFSMEVLYWILRLFGYAPFRLQLDADTPDRDAFGTWRTKLYTISFGLVYTLAFIKFMSELKHTGFSASMIEGKGERMYFTFNFFTTMYGVVNGYAVRDKIEKMLYKLHAVDQKISQWKRNVDHRRFYRNVWAGVYLIAIVLLIYIYGTIITCQLHESSCNMQILFVFIYLLFVNSYALMMLQCTAFMEIIRTRYKLINGCFRYV
uniref:Gustatory receptor n=1 Tax=Anopheles coluzzii TaxID=1518534 RepID=A0A8W7PL09_ANOCL